MAKTIQFEAIRRAMRRADFLIRHPHLKNAVTDFEGMKREECFRGRREFLKSSLALGVATVPLSVLLTNCASALTRTSAVPPGYSAKDFASEPVIILGGGLAGLTAAYRLANAGVKCHLYEAQSRLGGRVLTRSAFNSEGMFCEIGGELIDSSQTDLLDLAREVGLKIDDFRPGDAQDRVEQHLYYFKGQRYFNKDLAEAARPLVTRLSSDMKRVFGDSDEASVTYRNFTPHARRLDFVSLEGYLDSISDMEPWVREAVKTAYLTEYGLDPGDQSCINLMALIDPEAADFGIYGGSDEAMRIQGGNSRLVEALGSKIASKVRIHLDHRLVKVQEKGSKIVLTMSHGKEVSASRVICTLPFTLLREVEGLKALSLSPVKLRAIKSMGYGTNMKHMVGYKERVWRKPAGIVPGCSGYTFTDLQSQTLWDSSRAQAGNAGIITAFLGGRAALDPMRGTLDSVVSDVETLFVGTKSQHDGNHTLMRWGKHPFSKGSYTCPRPGQYTSIIGSAKEPELGGKLIFAGEHVSEKYQGYMNGAVESGNRAARAVLAALNTTEAQVAAH